MANVLRLCDGPPKKNLIINRDVSGGYCKTAVIGYYYTEFKGTRRAADTFARQIQYLNKDVQENIRLMLK